MDGLARGLQIQAWDPSFGAEVALDEEGSRMVPELALEVELPLAGWQPIPASLRSREPVVFVDGVQRIDARALSIRTQQTPTPVLLASIASGACVCGEQASIEAVRVSRLLLSSGGLPNSLRVGFGTYQLKKADRPGLPGLLSGLRSGSREQERETARSFSEQMLVIVDGPLTGTATQHPPHLVGYVKSHRAGYLQGRAEAVLLALKVLERTPVFRIEGDWPRYSYYLRLPSVREDANPWSSLCRIEISPQLPLEQVISRANRVAATVPYFASRPHRESRAPQNLNPISGLEQVLRNRLGDPLLVYRQLLQAVG